MNEFKVVCLCGSSRFGAAFTKAELDETLAGNTVIKIGFDLSSDTDFLASVSDERRDEVRAMLERLNLHKADMADELLVINIDGFIGEATKGIIQYAKKHKKHIRFLVDRGSNDALSIAVLGVPGHF